MMIDLSMNIILEGLHGFECSEEPATVLRRLSFPWFTLVDSSDDEAIARGWLHIATMDELSKASVLADEVVILCLCAKDAMPKDIGNFRSKVVFVNPRDSDSCLTVRDLFKEVRSVFVAVNEWHDRMWLMAQNGAPYEDLLMSSNEVIGNYITISDSSFRLIAKTSNVEQDDPATTDLVSNGMHSPNTIEIFESLKLLEKWRNSNEFFEIKEDSPICIYPTVSHVFRFKNNYFLHIVMLCNVRGITLGLLDLFRMLIEALNPLIERDLAFKRGFFQPYDRLLQGLIEHDVLSRETIGDLASNLHIPTEGAFSVACLDFSNTVAIGIEEAAWRYASHLSNSYVTIHDDLIVMLHVSSRNDPVRELLNSIEGSFSKDLAITAGFSNAFERIEDMHHAYAQACYALAFHERHSQDLHESIFSGSRCSESLVAFDSCFASFLMESKDGPLRDFSIDQHPFKQFLDSGPKKSLIRLVLTYVSSGCRASDTASSLYMHRNNVIYHIDHLANRYGLDLSNPDTRFEVDLLSRILPCEAQDD